MRWFAATISLKVSAIFPSIPRWSPVIRTEKSPLRIAWSAWSNCCEGSDLPLAYALALLRRRVDAAPDPTSLMEFPSSRNARSNRDRSEDDFLQTSIFAGHQIV